MDPRHGPAGRQMGARVWHRRQAGRPSRTAASAAMMWRGRGPRQARCARRSVGSEARAPRQARCARRSVGSEARAPRRAPSPAPAGRSGGESRVRPTWRLRADLVWRQRAAGPCRAMPPTGLPRAPSTAPPRKGPASHQSHCPEPGRGLAQRPAPPVSPVRAGPAPACCPHRSRTPSPRRPAGRNQPRTSRPRPQPQRGPAASAATPGARLTGPAGWGGDARDGTIQPEPKGRSAHPTDSADQPGGPPPASTAAPPCAPARGALPHRRQP